MDINQSKVSGNKDAIANLLHQGGVSDPTDEDDHDDKWEPDVIDISPYVILVHGDLSTCERVESLLDQRAIKDTPW